MDRSKLYKNLSILLEIFKNRPNHLSKYLIENSALSDEFIIKLLTSIKLNDMNVDNYFDAYSDMSTELCFNNVEEMDNYYSNIMIDTNNINDNENDKTELYKELNEKLVRYIMDEQYEDAIKIRDFMILYNIEINPPK